MIRRCISLCNECVVEPTQSFLNKAHVFRLNLINVCYTKVNTSWELYWCNIFTSCSIPNPFPLSTDTDISSSYFLRTPLRQDTEMTPPPVSLNVDTSLTQIELCDGCVYTHTLCGCTHVYFDHFRLITNT